MCEYSIIRHAGRREIEDGVLEENELFIDRGNGPMGALIVDTDSALFLRPEAAPPGARPAKVALVEVPQQCHIFGSHTLACTA